MSLTPEELDQVARELDGSLRGAVVQKAQLALPTLCYLELRVPGKTVALCLCAEPGVGRLSEAGERQASPREALSFQRWLRTELAAARLMEITARGHHVSLLFEREGKRRALHLSLSRDVAPLVLTGEAERILAVSATDPHLRPGLPYVPAAGDSGTAAAARRSRLQPVEGSPFPLAASAEALFGRAQRDRSVGEVRRRLLAPLKAQRARLQRTLAKVEAEASRGPQAEQAKRQGELLAQNLHRLTKGATRVSLTRYSSEGAEDEVIELDPALSGKDQVERLFHQYRRLTRGVEHARRRFAELDGEREALEARIVKVAQTPESALLNEAASLPPKPAGTGPPKSSPYKEYATARGERILVGKGGASNDQLTFKIAKPHDFWFHVRGVPGAHVVVPLPKGGQLPQEALLDAAHLALHHSDLKGEPRGEVSYTAAKFVRKVKGGAPGQVTYTRERTFAVRIEPARLERLLRSYR